MNPENHPSNRLRQFGRVFMVFVIALVVLFFGRDELFNPSTPGAQDNTELVDGLTDTEQKKLKQAYDHVKESQAYSNEYDVAAYLHKFDELPPNYITKDQAEQAGWIAEEGNLWDVTDKKSIGGDHFGNFEGNLPPNKYREADVNYHGGTRNGERIVYSEDGDIFYTENHYQTFKHFY